MLERVLIVGLGSIGRRHARLVRSLIPGIRIGVLRHAGCDDVNEIGIDQCFSNLPAALGFCPQAAVIASPSSHHVETASALAIAGVHLLIEKPISNNTAGVARLIEECGSRKLTLMTGYNLRFQESLRQFRELIAQRRVGHVLSARAEVGQFLPTWRPGSDYRQTVSAQAALGGGVLLEASHEIDYLRWLFGEVDWVSAVLRKQSSLEVDVEDTAHLVLGFAGGTHKAPVVAALSMDFIRHDRTRSCTVIGETGSLRWDALTGKVDVFDEGTDAWRCLFAHPNPRDESYLREWHHFLQCVTNGDAPLVSGSDGLAVLRIIEAAQLSSNTGSIARVVKEEVQACTSRGPAWGS
jgi:predicted dehydrogenase